ncbi:protein kinase domain-containing protein [Candidatus Uabimicrobium amorphum]|uniref:non-specific serine/threonine protein kinase n=1 Tax=Uabimicrobium amorphum TaxID=2596890 RepID=A0A5S9F5S7_UABAM|nr:protein kinase [Candidatus Uabimicrobium amorphum]BBM85929.1 protein kinase [Candidatus Uabimicrobium amorphum]
MNYRTQSLIYQAQSLGYLGKDIPPSFDIDAFLQQKISRQDSYYIYFLYVKHCLLNKAQQRGLISEPQKNSLWQKSTQQRNAPKLFCGEENVVSVTFYEKSVQELMGQNVFSALEKKLFLSLVAAWQNRHAQTANNATVAVSDRTEVLSANVTIADSGQVVANETIASSFGRGVEEPFSKIEMDSNANVTIADSGQVVANETIASSFGRDAEEPFSRIEVDVSPEETIASVHSPSPNTPVSTSHISSTAHAKSALENSDLFAGRYRIEKELGRGGMGVVYKVYDENLGRDVALKLVLAKHATEVQIRRFLKEAQVVAKLDHPNTIRIFDIGEFPQKYFTMEYIEGKTLTEYINDKSLDFATIAKIMHKVAQALQNAHRQNLIHRDIKPSNIMLDVKKQPRLMDFGLVKDADSDLSHEGDILGTPAYMSPEQAHGQEAVPGSDIYSLGATLYQSLTGCAPFSGSSALNIIVQIMQKDPVPPRELNPDIPRELEAITLKCMEKKVAKRYRSAHALAKDLENYLQNRPIIASSPTQLTYLKKWILRNKAVSIMAFSSFLVILFVVSLSSYLYVREITRKDIEEQKKRTEISEKARIKLQAKKDELQVKKDELQAKKDELQANKDELKRKNDDLEKNIYNANIALAALRIENINISGARQALSRCDEERQQNWEWKWLYKTLEIEHTSFGQTLYNYCGFHPKKGLFVAANNNYLELWNVRNTLKPVWHSPAVNDKITCCSFSQNGKWIIVGTYGGDPNRNRLYGKPAKNLYLVDSATGKIIHTYEGHAYAVRQVSFSSDDKLIVSGGDDCCIKIWKATPKSTKPLQSIDLLQKIKKIVEDSGIGKESLRSTEDYEVSSCAFSKNKQYIIATRDDVLILWKKTSRKYQLLDESSYSLDLKRYSGSINHCVFHPTMNMIVVATKNGSIDLWSVTKNKLNFVRSLEKVHKLEVEHCTFSKDGKQMLSCGRDTNIVLWEVESQANIFVTAKYYGHAKRILNCDFSTDNKSFISAADTIKLWSINEKSRPAMLAKKANAKIERRGDFAKTAEHRHLFASAGDDGLKIWDWHKQKLYKTLGKNRQFYQCTFHPHKNLVATTDKRPDLLRNALKKVYEVTLWNVNSGESQVVGAHKRAVRFCAFSDDGRYLASISKRIKIFDFENNNEFELRHSHKGGIRWCGFAPNDNNVFITASEKIIIWDLKNKKELHSFRDNIYKIHFADFHPTLPLLITADSHVLDAKQDISFAVWDFENKKSLGHISGSKSNINACFFDARGERIITVSRDRAVRIWDFEAKAHQDSIHWKSQELLTLRKHRASIHHGSLSPDGNALISIGEDGEMFLWSTR